MIKRPIGHGLIRLAGNRVVVLNCYIKTDKHGIYYLSNSHPSAKKIEEKMKRIATVRPIVLAVLLVMFAAGFFWVGQAYATTGCFTDTNGHWAEVAICWMKDNGITGGVGGGLYAPEGIVTRAQMAAFMQRQAEIPPSTGEIDITPGNSEWSKFTSADNLSFIYYSNRTIITSPATTFNFVSMQPTIPTTLYGRSLQFMGVELCYAASANAAITYIEVNTPSSSNGTASQNMRFTDTTTRQDTACRYYLLSAPVILTPENGVNLYVGVNYTAGNSITLSRATFVFLPTTTKPAAVSRPVSENTVVLAPSTGPSPTSGGE